ncbi:tubulin-specific chaperone E [Chanos chanos]|uniref:Tubulin-specific chaperone E n=1 Tax=Chanos chanos TaxID=29144 RepID=A0A6J2V4L8_CHACN|nr:tubulin-specific chaperone E [Chanos chanos]
MVPEDTLGRRIVCDGERGTVRYVGTVPPTAGLWLGIEWDNPERGKHDGTHEGVCYFTCRHPTGGSFVRPKKVSFGVDYVTALRQRYETELDQIIGEEVKISTKTVELVGFEAVSQKQRVENLTEVALRRCDVSGPGPEKEIRKTTPYVVSLDLSSNLLNSWETVAAITEQLEALEELQLSYNRLQLSSDPLSLKHAFCRLRVLSLKNCDVTWPQLLECAPIWPQLEELYVSSNNITELKQPIGVLQNLTVLDLSNNSLVQESVSQISNLPRLEKLNLSSSGLSVICFNDVSSGNKTAMFSSLKNLMLDDNKIAEWWVVNEMEKLRALVQLSCRRNPLIDRERNHETARQLLIARLSQLEVLDMREVLAEERRGAELDYIRMFGTEWLQAGGNADPAKNHSSDEFTSQHPRYQSLIKKYGAPEEGELQKQKPFALKNQLLTIKFVCPEETDRKPIEKKLPGSMIVQKVKGLLFRLLKIPGADLRLTYSSSKMEGKEIDIDNDLKPLQFYSIENGDTILVRWS